METFFVSIVSFVSFVSTFAAATMIDEKGKKIIQDANAVFMKYGIKSVTMDEMARQLSVSKKTLYKYVKDKEDLLRHCCTLQAEEEDVMVESIMGQGLNAIDESLEIMKIMIDMLKEIHPSVIFDMEKYYPEVLNDMMHGREKAINECVLANLQKGQSEGLYRTDFNPDIISHIYAISIEHSFHHLDGSPIEKMSFSERYLDVARYHIRGIASDKGLAYLKQKVKEFHHN